MIPRVRFAHLPTPIEHLPRLGKFLGLPNLYIKRDDQTGLALGGNKTRKLEFLIAEAQAQQATTLITAGAVQSNHCRQTAAAAARFGYQCILVLTGEKPPSPSANLLLDELLGAEVIYVGKQMNRERILADTFNKAAEEGKKPYLIPYGGSNKTGALGYVFALQELLAQMPKVDWIVFASSSGGTQAGLVLGARLFGFSGKVLGISVDERSLPLQTRVAELSTTTSMFFGERIDFTTDEILVNDHYCSTGYGVLTDIERKAIQLFAQNEGLLLDPVYTGRAAAGLIDLAHKGLFKKEATVLFWHTGGQPSLFAEQYQFS